MARLYIISRTMAPTTWVDLRTSRTTSWERWTARRATSPIRRCTKSILLTATYLTCALVAEWNPTWISSKTPRSRIILRIIIITTARCFRRVRTLQTEMTPKLIKKLVSRKYSEWILSIRTWLKANAQRAGRCNGSPATTGLLAKCKEWIPIHSLNQLIEVWATQAESMEPNHDRRSRATSPRTPVNSTTFLG